MANLRAIRKRIASVKNTRQITRAMKLVSGAKLKRATDAAVAARPYNRKLKEILGSLLARTEDRSNPLFQVRDEVKRIVVVAFSSDRGLCGSFNTNVCRRVDLIVRENPEVDIQIVSVGRKVRDHVKRRNLNQLDEHTGVAPAQYAKTASRMAAELVSSFESGEVDEVHLVYTQFRSAISQTVVAEQLLPLVVPPSQDEGAASGSQIDFIYEPARGAILDALLPQLVANRVMQAFLESTASEHGSRMTAMENATRNASEMIDRLTLEYNRARQAAITKELVEIVSGAEAL